MKSATCKWPEPFLEATPILCTEKGHRFFLAISRTTFPRERGVELPRHFRQISLQLFQVASQPHGEKKEKDPSESRKKVSWSNGLGHHKKKTRYQNEKEKKKLEEDYPKNNTFRQSESINMGNSPDCQIRVPPFSVHS
ncbi:hypothetical protein NPIL_95021 [Nephila pilipes]|uniref:Uncharacterized protein n=1 Tax=Nephila pilipes TaxID=299642 RepID=A0A8X6MX33_NEPPI|nr:hypothetical protein NPIL_95021 [Nephila pilipes]